MSKYFNSETYAGRANVAKATYASFALLYIFYRVRRYLKNDTNPADQVKVPEGCDFSNSNDNDDCYNAASNTQCECDVCKKNYVQEPCPPPKTQPDRGNGSCKENSKLNIPEDPLSKKQKKKCECDNNDSNGKNKKSSCESKNNGNGNGNGNGKGNGEDKQNSNGTEKKQSRCLRKRNFVGSEKPNSNSEDALNGALNSAPSDGCK